MFLNVSKPARQVGHLRQVIKFIIEVENILIVLQRKQHDVLSNLLILR